MISILVVDDNQAIIDVMQAWFDFYVCELVTTNSPNRALELAAEKEFDVIITDVLMPRMTGFELTEKLRTLTSAKIVGLTASFTKGEMFDAYLSKPFMLDDLIEAVETLTGKELIPKSRPPEPLGDFDT